MSKLAAAQKLYTGIPKWRRTWFWRFFGVGLAVFGLLAYFLEAKGVIYFQPAAYAILPPFFAALVAHGLVNSWSDKLSPYKGRRKQIATTFVEAPQVMLQRSGPRFNSTPIITYGLRLYAVGLFGGILGLLLGFWATDFESQPVQVWHVAIICFLAVLGAWIPALPVIHLRPHVVADETGMDIVVHPFFTNEAVLGVYGAEGYGDDYLSMVIDYMEPASITWADVKRFKIEKRRGMYRLKAVLQGRKSVYVYGRYSRKKVQAIQAQLETYQKSAAA